MPLDPYNYNNRNLVLKTRQPEGRLLARWLLGHLEIQGKFILSLILLRENLPPGWMSG